jgi:peptide/nickel transport system permease protein
MRGVDILLALPPVMMAIAVAATLGPGVRNVVLAMTIVLVAPMTRVARGAVLSVKNEVYVTAARSLGVSERRIFVRHVLPNAASPIIAYAFSLVGIMIVFAAGLSFLGLGVQPPTADWGRMVNEGRVLLSTDPWLSTLPGLAIFFVGLGFGLVGEWLDDLVGGR